MFVKKEEKDFIARSLWDILIIRIWTAVLKITSILLQMATISYTARECPAPLEYSECTSSCPRTCKTLYLVEPDECKMCISGCQCPVGTFLQNGQCVKPDECMCEFNKKQYKHGDTIKQRCNLWWVKGVIWKVTCLAPMNISFLKYLFLKLEFVKAKLKRNQALQWYSFS